MRTLVISDLHLGVRTRRRRAAPARRARRRCARAWTASTGSCCSATRSSCATARPATALAVAEPALRAIGAALGPGGEVVLLAGNHDHALVAGWLDWRGRREDPGPLGARRARRAAARVVDRPAPRGLARAARPSTVAYPGVWLREDVYAMHGHYLDVHTARSRRFERARPRARWRAWSARSRDPATPDDYEALLAPIYAWIHAAARSARAERAGRARRRHRGQGLEHARGRRGPRARRARGALRAGFRARASRPPTAPASARCAPTLSGRRAAPRRRSWRWRRSRGACDIAPAHLLFGHTHRTGMLAGDDRRRVAHAGGHAAAQQRLLGLRDALHGRRAGRREPLLARRRDRARRRRRRRAWSACSATSAARAAQAAQRRGELHGVADARRAPTSSVQLAAVWRSCSTSGTRRSARRRSRGRRCARRTLGLGRCRARARPTRRRPRRARPGARLLGGLRGEQRARLVLGAQRARPGRASMPSSSRIAASVSS